MRKAFLVGVGAVSMGAEKSQEIVSDLVKKGELTVEQGKTLNEELRHKVSEVAEDSGDAFLKTRLKGMTPEERQNYVKKAKKIIEELEAEDVEVEVDPEAVEEVAEDDEDAEA